MSRCRGLETAREPSAEAQAMQLASPGVQEDAATERDKEVAVIAAEIIRRSLRREEVMPSTRVNAARYEARIHRPHLRGRGGHHAARAKAVDATERLGRATRVYVARLAYELSGLTKPDPRLSLLLKKVPEHIHRGLLSIAAEVVASPRVNQVSRDAWVRYAAAREVASAATLMRPERGMENVARLITDAVVVVLQAVVTEPRALSVVMAGDRSEHVRAHLLQPLHRRPVTSSMRGR